MPLTPCRAPDDAYAATDTPLHAADAFAAAIAFIFSHCHYMPPLMRCYFRGRLALPMLRRHDAVADFIRLPPCFFAAAYGDYMATPFFASCRYFVYACRLFSLSLR
jgi:hypothetical protein